MSAMRVTRLLFAICAFSLLSSCGAEDESGACSGTMNGAYFQLRIGNYQETGIDVRINGRFIGKVAAGEKDISNPSLIHPGVKTLGEFPVCDKMVIDARGSGIASTKLCSTPQFLTSACSGPPNYDFCWKNFYLEPSSGCDSGNCVPFDIGMPECPCANAFIQC